VEPNPEGARHFQDGRKAGVAILAERLVEALATETGVPRDLRHALGPGNVAQGARGVRHNVLLSLNLHFPDPESTRAGLTAQRQWAANMAYGPLVKYLPQLGARKRGFDALFEALADWIGSGWSKDDDRASRSQRRPRQGP